MRTPEIVPLVAGLGIAMAALLGCRSRPEPGPAPGPRIPGMQFIELDVNEDEQVDPAEFQKLADALFARLDTDRNGRLSETEYGRLLERPRRRRGGWSEHGPGSPGRGSPGGGLPDGGW